MQRARSLRPMQRSRDEPPTMQQYTEERSGARLGPREIRTVPGPCPWLDRRCLRQFSSKMAPRFFLAAIARRTSAGNHLSGQLGPGSVRSRLRRAPEPWPAAVSSTPARPFASGSTAREACLSGRRGLFCGAVSNAPRQPPRHPVLEHAGARRHSQTTRSATRTRAAAARPLRPAMTARSGVRGDTGCSASPLEAARHTETGPPRRT